MFLISNLCQASALKFAYVFAITQSWSGVAWLLKKQTEWKLDFLGLAMKIFTGDSRN